MPAGERSQVRYPSALACLRARWRSDCTWKEVVSLRDSLQYELDQHRSSRNIVPSIVRCHTYGSVGPGAPPKISVRAMLIALRRFAITSQAEAKQREKDWELRRKVEYLDLYGHRARTMQ